MKRGVKHKSSAMGNIRIISGQWRGRKLPVLERPGLRPTTDRTKETLFNWLAPYIHGRRCLDAFAGAGSLGIESLSRYAEHCTFIEMDKGAASQIQQNLSLLKVSAEQARVLQGDSLKLLSDLPQGFDLVFVDPPFQQGFVPKIITALEQNHLLTDNALIYIETELNASHYQVPENWQCIKQSSTKQLCYRLYQKQSQDS